LNLNANLRRYLDGATPETGRQPDARYTSFDYCFNYFQSFRDSGNVAYPENIQFSCLQLGFYLASWGMLRGSAKLLQKSARHFAPVVEVIASMDRTFWEIDADGYSESNIGETKGSGVFSDILPLKRLPTPLVSLNKVKHDV